MEPTRNLGDMSTRKDEKMATYGTAFLGGYRLTSHKTELEL